MWRWTHWIVLVVAGSGLLIGSPAGAQEQGTIERERGYYVERIVREFDVSPGGTLDLITDSGHVDVESWQQSQVKVVVTKTVDADSEEEAAELTERFEIYIDSSGNDVRVRGEQRGRRHRDSADVGYVITLPSRFDVDIETSGGHIEVDDLTGKMRLQTSGGHISIGDVTGGPVAARTAGGHISLDAVDGGPIDLVTAGGHIEVGEVTGELEVRTAGGHISIEQGGERTSASTAGGHIEVDAAAGDVSVETSGGGIRIGRIDGDVSAETSGGNISVKSAAGTIEVGTSGGNIRIGTSGGAIEAQTSGGNIDIEEAGGPVMAETAGGDIEVELGLATKGLTDRTRLSSSGGDIRLRIPSTLAATVEAEIYISRRHGRDYRIYSDFPLVVEGADTRRVSAHGDLNGGGPLIELETEDGDIRIKESRGQR